MKHYIISEEELINAYDWYYKRGRTFNIMKFLKSKTPVEVIGEGEVTAQGAFIGGQDLIIVMYDYLGKKVRILLEEIE